MPTPKKYITGEEASDKILQAIEQSLPASSAEVIKSALNERDELRSEVDRLNQELSDCSKAYDAASTERTSYYEERNSAQAQVVELQKLLETAEETARNAKVDIAEGKLAVVQQTVDSFLRNVTVRRNIATNVNSMTPNPQYGGNGNENRSENTTESEE